MTAITRTGLSADPEPEAVGQDSAGAENEVENVLWALECCFPALTDLSKMTRLSRETCYISSS